MKFDATVFFDTLFSNVFIMPAVTTLGVTLAAMVIGIIIGLFCALLSDSRFRFLRSGVRGYLFVFRGTPVLVQIVFWYDAVAELTSNVINIPALLAGIIALGVNEGAYMTEIVRSGLLAVDPGQREAARSLGMTYRMTMRRIVIPQALRIILPPAGNQFISMLKTTSLLFTVAVPELFSTGTNLYSVNFRYFEILSVMTIWYLVLTSLITFGQRRMERRLSRRPEPSISARFAALPGENS